MTKHWLQGLVAAVLVLMGLAAAPNQAADAATVRIHGEPGVTFAAYDVTEPYWALGGGTHAQSRIAKGICGRKIVQGSTDRAGRIDFPGLPRAQAGRLAVYKFVQVQGPAGQHSQTMVVTLPALGDLELYPKSAVRPRFGGQAFRKVDGTTQRGLAGAVFVVQNLAGQTLTVHGDWRAGQHLAADQWRHLESDHGGRFVIDGLVPGQYRLVEVRAPGGYQVLNVPVAFTVRAGVTAADTAPLKIANRPKRVGLPQTGSVWALSLTALGALMLALIVALKKAPQSRN
ncbi:collagen binding domain-containing protein [Lacticaseibacillus sp. 53-4]|uniref:MSCRAMM family protein n=1 Tax=Lacticaseibacillus sp. 53-4 TaxID=2799575 RepID=UPI00194589E6|nr:SpaA isopeptide-forming pilin-related protein [Lacticaseibacillus sp. 53-4]